MEWMIVPIKPIELSQDQRDKTEVVFYNTLLFVPARGKQILLFFMDLGLPFAFEAIPVGGGGNIRWRFYLPGSTAQLLRDKSPQLYRQASDEDMKFRNDQRLGHN